MASCNVYVTGYTTAEVEASANSAANNDRYWTIYLNGVEYDSWYDKSQDVAYELTGLSAGTTYRVEVRYGATGTEYGTGGTKTFTTLRPDYSLLLTVTASAIGVRATATLITGARSKLTDLTLYLDGSRALECDIAAGQTSRYRIWNGVSTGTVYTVTLYDRDTEISYTATARTKNDFSWYVTPVSGEDFILKANGTGSWNDFTSQLKSKERYYTGTNRTFTSAAVGSDFTYTMFNQAVNAINNIASKGAPGCTTTMDTVTKGSPVNAADLIKLATCLNE